MNTPQIPSRFIAFLDECGDHSLEKIDKDFPLFVLSAVVVERNYYVEKIVPEIAKLKLTFWNHEGVNLHSRDIRMSQGDFSFLQNSTRRNAFVERLNSLIKSSEFTLFISAIDKNKHKTSYGNEATNPYDLALGHIFKNLQSFLEDNNEQNIPIVAESRGKNEDTQLINSFHQLISSNKDFVKLFSVNSNFCWPNFPITFRRKHDNIAGIQIADLCAYPVARKILNPDKINHAFDIIYPHIYVHDFIAK